MLDKCDGTPTLEGLLLVAQGFRAECPIRQCGRLNTSFGELTLRAAILRATVLRRRQTVQEHVGVGVGVGVGVDVGGGGVSDAEQGCNRVLRIRQASSWVRDAGLHNALKPRHNLNTGNVNYSNTGTATSTGITGDLHTSTNATNATDANEEHTQRFAMLCLEHVSSLLLAFLPILTLAQRRRMHEWANDVCKWRNAQAENKSLSLSLESTRELVLFLRSSAVF